MRFGKQFPAVNGSSPRVRGTVIDSLWLKRYRRFIPAGAGNGLSLCSQFMYRAVHPRGCGERTSLSDSMKYQNGSSPRVRGTVVEIGLPAEHVRFIPAGAGNGRTLNVFITVAAVHPRGCGERFPAANFSRARDGSSPRVRGTDDAAHHRAKPERFIPAGAGNGRPGDN